MSGKTEKDYIKVIGGTHEDSTFPSLEKRERERIMDEFLAEKKDYPDWEHLIDIGCSYGSWAEYFHDKGYRVTGVDISASRLREAARRGYETVCADAGHKLPFPDGEFDGAVMLDVLVHMLSSYDGDKAVKEAVRVVKPGSFIIVSIANGVGHFPERSVGYCRFESVSHVTGLLAEAGAEVVAVRGIHYTPLMLRLPLPAWMARVVFIKAVKK